MNAYRTTYRALRDAIAIALAFAITGALAVTFAMGGAHAATVTHTATPAQAACTAFAAWERNGTSGNLGRLVTASAGLGRSWLKADVLELAATVSSPSHKAGKYIPADRNYVTEDCAKL